MDRLKGKVAVITGAGRGIGEAIAMLFAEEGAKITLCDVNVEDMDRVAAAIRAKGGEALPVKVNICVKQEVEAVVKKTLEKFGKLHILINNAGITRDCFVKKMDEAKWDDVLDVNLKGTFLMAQAAMVPMSEANYGRIINTASIAAYGNMGQANYAASKAGVVAFTQSLALELARYNVTVNAVAPGFTETPMTAPIPEDIKKTYIARIPLKRMAHPVEIARAHLFLASEEAAFITGHVLFVDGGMTVGL
ncbi:MAG: 3-oxoacyl-ACP reductase FabG [bacterium]